MSTPQLVKLTITHLRGSVTSFELPFEKGKKLTIIYGENGTGKSTICDALEFLSKGNIGSLDNRGLGKTSQYWNTISKTAADIVVTLEAAGTSCQARMVKGNVVVQPASSQPRVEVLRRSQILDLIEARPGDRYAAISRFIDVSAVETSEVTLRQLIRDLNSNRNLAAARILENQETIQQFWETAGSPGADALTWAEAEAQRTLVADDPELAMLRALQTAYGRLAEYPNRLLAVDATLRSAKQAVTLAQQQVSTQLRDSAPSASELVALLQAAHSYLQTHPEQAICPLCERAAGAAELDARIMRRLEDFAAVREAQNEEQAAAHQLQRAEQQRELFDEQLAKDVSAFTAACTMLAPSAIPLPPSQPSTALALPAWLAATADLPARWNQAESARQDQRKFLTTLKSVLQTYVENTQGQQELDELLPKLQRTLEIVEEERKAFTDAMLDTIASEVGRMYEQVHPGEGLDKIRLELDAKKRASLEIGTSFCGQSGPPQAYFSQSHLDTLGLCVFLALAKLDDAANTVLVLDDVLASVDEPHVDRLISMLYGEALHFRHCIITTHYGPWRHKLRWGWLKNNQCQFVELSRWSNTTGMAVIRSVPEVERLRALLADPTPDPQAVCSKAGVILEAALDFLTQLYECSVPRKLEPRYTLGELLPAIRGKLRQTLRVEVQSGRDAHGTPTYTSVPLLPMLDELQRIAQTRNVVGCHFNAISFDLLDVDALAFGQKVLDLIEALADPAAGWPRNDKSGSYWANAGETRRLHPLKQPS